MSHTSRPRYSVPGLPDIRDNVQTPVSFGLNRAVIAKLWTPTNSLRMELNNRNLSARGSRSDLQARLAYEYCVDELLGWSVGLERSVKILPFSDAPTLWKLPVGCFLISINHCPNGDAIIKLGLSGSGIGQSQPLFIKVEPDEGRRLVRAVLDGALKRRLNVTVPPYTPGFKPGNILMVDPRPIVESVVASGKVPIIRGAFRMLGVRLAGMRSMAYISFVSHGVQPAHGTMASESMVGALDLAG